MWRCWGTWWRAPSVRRPVVWWPAGRGGGHEVIRSGGVLARRIIAGEDRSSTVGMMLLRHGVWRVHEAVGDGGAITAALVHALARGGLRFLAAGVGAADLRRGLERACRRRLEPLRARPGR